MNCLLASICAGALIAASQPLEESTQKGPVQATVRLEPPEPLIGDPVRLTLRVVAEKGVELLLPEFGQALERFAILDFSTTDQIDPEGRTVATQIYELLPPRSGKQNIPSLLIEFVDHRDDAKAAPDGLDAYELLTERIAFEVRSVLPKDAKAQLNPPMSELPPIGQAARPVWPWLVGILIALAVATPFLWRAWIAARRRSRRRSAYDIAAARLHRLLGQPRGEPHEIDRFFVELSAIVRRYLEDRYELRAPELTTEEFLDAISQSPEVLDRSRRREHQALLRDFLRRADLVKFANLVPSEPDVDESVAAARRFLEETRQDAPLIDAPPAPPNPPETPTGGPPNREVARV